MAVYPTDINLFKVNHRNKKISDSNGILIPKHLVRKHTLNDWVFIYKLIGCGFKSRCCHLNFTSDIAPVSSK